MIDQLNKKGFTLIELLAVIILLAIIALIATPIVLNIIKSTKEQALKRSSELYISAVNNALMSNKLTENINITDGEYSLSDDGNICIDSECIQVLKVDLSGDKPVKDKSSITLENFKIKYYILNYGDKKGYVIKDEIGTTVGLEKLNLEKSGMIAEPITNPTGSSLFLGNTLGVTREQIESIKIEKTNNVPSNAIGSWDVSAEKNSGKVMAWYTDLDSNNLYEVHIGGKNGVKANENSQSLFKLLTELTSLDVKNLDTSNVTNMKNMFYNCSKLTTLDLSSWNTGNVTNMTQMFEGCSSLTNIELSSWDTSKVTSMGRMFCVCSKLTTLNLKSWNTGNVINMYQMFEGCSALTNIELSSWNTSKVTLMYNMFGGCSNLTSLDLSNWDTSNVTNMSAMFVSCTNLASLVGIGNWDTSKVTNMSTMFRGCSNLTSLELSSWDTSKVTNMYDMFSYCTNLTSLVGIGNWDTSKVTTMAKMFRDCSSLTSLDMKKWDTSKVMNMEYMFVRCNKLEKLDLSNWDTSNVTSMRSMFSEAYDLTSLKMPNFVIKDKDVDLIQFLYGCSKLTSIDFSNSTIADMGDLKPNYMFYRKSIQTEEENNKLIIITKDEQSRSWLESNCTVNCEVKKA